VPELALVVIACGAATYLWRGLGVVISGRLDPDSEAFRWVACVAFAMIAGLVARMLLIPTGTLAETTPVERLLGTAGALGAYFWLTRRNLFAGVLAGATVIWLLKWLAG
jgi:branched-subunit amino acid transport protein